MALDSTSTAQDAIDQYNDNLAWPGNPTKAAALYEAVLWMLGNRAKVQEVGSMQLEFDSLASLERDLRSYVASTSSTAHRSTFVRGFARL